LITWRGSSLTGLDSLFFTTAQAQTAEFNNSVLDVAPAVYIGRNLERIKNRPVEVIDSSAPSADQMVVRLEVAVESDTIIQSLDAPDDPTAFERVYGPVDGVEGDGRKPSLYPAVNVFGRRMT
jgi:hypothetical protein